jgi:glutathione S-transferase
MAKPKLYGVPGSRAIRSLWAIEDIGIEYEHVPVNLMDKSQKAAFLAVNPNGRIPALQDGDIALFESMAINLYLARTYGGDLYPRDPAAEAQTWQWSVWVMTEIEAAQMDIMAQKFFVPEEKRDPGVIEAAEKTLDRPLKVLDAALATKQWLAGNAFSIADLNVAGVMLILKIVKFDYAAYPNVQFWLDACYARPSLKRAQRVGK